MPRDKGRSPAAVVFGTGIRDSPHMADRSTSNGQKFHPLMRYPAILFCALLFLATGCHRKQPQLCLLSDPEPYTTFRVTYYFTRETKIKLTQFEYHDGSGATSLEKLTEEQAHPEINTFHPPVDVYWGGDPIYCEILKERGLTIPYHAAHPIRSEYRDPNDDWTGIAARTRVLLVRNSLKFRERPKSILAYVDPAWHGRGVLADPLVGTMRSHFAALAVLWGDRKLASFYADALKNGTRITKTEAESADLVVAGKADFALVGSDVALTRIQKGPVVDIVYPDQEPGELGVMVMPNAVSIMKGCKDLNVAHRLVDFLTSLEGERRILSFSPSQVPLQPGLGTSSVNTWRLEELHTMHLDYPAAARKILAMDKILANTAPTN